MGKIGVGSLKPAKVKAKKIHAKVIEIVPAGLKKLKRMVAKVPIKN